jgi:hypothetical protein
MPIVTANQLAAQQAHPADAPAEAIKIGRFLKIAGADLRMWLSQGRG